MIVTTPGDTCLYTDSAVVEDCVDVDVVDVVPLVDAAATVGVLCSINVAANAPEPVPPATARARTAAASRPRNRLGGGDAGGAAGASAGAGACERSSKNSCATKLLTSLVKVRLT